MENTLFEIEVPTMKIIDKKEVKVSTSSSSAGSLQ